MNRSNLISTHLLDFVLSFSLSNLFISYSLSQSTDFTFYLHFMLASYFSVTNNFDRLNLFFYLIHSLYYFILLDSIYLFNFMSLRIIFVRILQIQSSNPKNPIGLLFFCGNMDTIFRSPFYHKKYSLCFSIWCQSKIFRTKSHHVDYYCEIMVGKSSLCLQAKSIHALISLTN